MYAVGLTGGIASGKSAVASALATLGATVVDTDLVAREVVEPGTPGLAGIVAEFGSAVLTPERTLDRRALRTRVFADAAGRERLEHILHPLIRARTIELMAAAKGPYVVVVVPLLIETDFARLVDRILVVDCPEELQTQRLVQRDAISQAEAEAMIASQVSRAERLRHADDVLVNDAGLAELERAAADLHLRYLELAAARTD